MYAMHTSTFLKRVSKKRSSRYRGNQEYYSREVKISHPMPNSAERLRKMRTILRVNFFYLVKINKN